MALKNYSIRLDEDEYEKLKKYLNEHGDAEINIGFVLRQYIRDLNRAIPGLKTTGLDPRLTFSLIGSMLKQFHRNSDILNIIQGAYKGKKILDK